MKLPPGAAQRLTVPGIVAAALIAGGAVAVVLTQRLVQKAAGEQQTAAAERQSAQSKLERATDEEREIHDRLVDYRKLLDRGVIGDEHRLDWVDRIGEIKTARKLFDVRYSIDVAEAGRLPRSRRRRRRRVHGEPDEARDVAAARGGPVPIPGRPASRAQCARGGQVVQPPAEPTGSLRPRARPRLQATCDIDLVTIRDRKMGPA